MKREDLQGLTLFIIFIKLVSKIFRIFAEKNMYLVIIINILLIFFIGFQVVFYINILNISRKKLKLSIVDLQNKLQYPISSCPPKDNKLFASDIYKKFKEQSSNDSCHIKEEDWVLLENAILSNYNNFDEKVGKTTELNCKEYRISLLLKCKFKPKEISNIMCQSKENITSIRRRLCKKYIDASSASPQKWDNFINNI